MEGGLKREGGGGGNSEVLVCLDVHVQRAYSMGSSMQVLCLACAWFGIGLQAQGNVGEGVAIFASSGR